MATKDPKCSIEYRTKYCHPDVWYLKFAEWQGGQIAAGNYKTTMCEVETKNLGVKVGIKDIGSQGPREAYGPSANPYERCPTEKVGGLSKKQVELINRNLIEPLSIWDCIIELQEHNNFSI